MNKEKARAIIDGRREQAASLRRSGYTDSQIAEALRTSAAVIRDLLIGVPRPLLETREE